MITYGFSAGYVGPVVLDTNFPKPSGYIYVGTAEGDIVFENTNGENQVLTNAGLGYHILAARRVLTGATINGTPYTTGAEGMSYLSTGIP